MFNWLWKKKTNREIIISAESLEARVAVVENGNLEEFQVEYSNRERIVGSIYKGRIQNLEHNLQAAFVDIGLKKNAFLHYWDMVPEDFSAYDIDERPQNNGRGRRNRYSNAHIEKHFPPGSEIAVQVTKGPIGTKGPRVTASLSIPGRYLVLLPGANITGVSRKIGDAEERKRLKKLLDRVPVPSGCGLIIRTAASGTSRRGVVRDLRVLTSIWSDMQATQKDNPAPCCIYQEPDLVERVVRDWLTEDIDRIILDSEDEYERIRSIAARISRRAKSQIQCYQGALPIFEHFKIERQIEEAFSKKVELKSGGYLIFDETEAMIAIDVNTGRHKGRGSQEEAILGVNTEAVEEIARQLRLRNIGGIIVVDLIDMKSKKHRQSVFKAMKNGLKRDKARTNVLPISELGILEMTRQRYEESITSLTHMDCPYCHGRGAVKSPLGMSVDIQRQVAAVMRKMKAAEESMNLQVVVHPTVLERLRNEDEQFLLELEQKFKGRLSFKTEPSKHIEFFSISNAETGDLLYARTEKQE